MFFCIPSPEKNEPFVLASVPIEKQRIMKGLQISVAIGIAHLLGSTLSFSLQRTLKSPKKS